MGLCGCNGTATTVPPRWIKLRRFWDLWGLVNPSFLMDSYYRTYNGIHSHNEIIFFSNGFIIITYWPITWSMNSISEYGGFRIPPPDLGQSEVSLVGGVLCSGANGTPGPSRTLDVRTWLRYYIKMQQHSYAMFVYVFVYPSSKYTIDVSMHIK